MLWIYLALLTLGVLSFILHYVAQAAIIHRLKHAHPERWKIVHPPEQRVAWLARWLRVTMILKTTVPPLHSLLNDTVIARWQRCWTWAPRFAWAAWLAAIAVRWLAH